MRIFEDFNGPHVNELLKESSALDAEAGTFYGDVLKIQGKVKEAETFYAMAADMGSLAGIESIGLSLQQRGKNNEAIAWLQRAVDLHSEESLLPLAKAFIAIHQIADAERILDQAAESTLADSRIFKLILAWEFFCLGNYQKAIKTFESEYDKSGQQDGYCAQHIAEMYLLLNESSEARKWINKGKEKLDNPIHFYLLEADCFFAEGKLSEALKIYLEITSMKEDNEWLEEDDIFVGLRIAKTYKDSGNEKEFSKWSKYSERLANRAATFVFSEFWNGQMPSGPRKFYIDELTSLVISLNLENETSNAWFNWGVCDFREGRFQSAINKLETALSQKDSKAESAASFFLMHIYSELGQTEKSSEMKSRNKASGGYYPSTLDKERIRLLNL